MNASEAKAVAAFLGEPYQVGPDLAIEHVDDTCGLTDADLLLACLLRAAQLGLTPWLTFGSKHNDETVWRVSLWKLITDQPDEEGYYCLSRTGPTPLAAMIAAIVAYQAASQEARSKAQDEGRK